MDAPSQFPIDNLPPELLVDIFRCCHRPPPSETKVRDEPHPDMFTTPEGARTRGRNTLKNIALVSKKWRALALPVLFRHVIWCVDSWFSLFSIDVKYLSTPDRAFPILCFIRKNHLATYVESLTILVRHQPRPLADDNPGVPAPFWDIVFGLLDPLRLTLLGSPHSLTSMVSKMLFDHGDLPANPYGKPPFHILSLERKTRSPNSPSAQRFRDNLGRRIQTVSDTSAARDSGGSRPQPTTRLPSHVFTIRPWSHLLLNEGSSIRIYRNYEYFLRRPPSILGHLLGCEEAPNDQPLIPATVKSLSYIAIFPLASHFSTLVDHLPVLDRLYVQLVPQNDIMLDPEEMSHVQPSDLWMERNSCYGHIMRQMLFQEHDEASGSGGEEQWINPDHEPGNWRFLREFESGDSADREAWELAVGIVYESGSNWRVKRDGVFVKGYSSAAT
ncbi:hypothetical protein QBC42DRAFT_349531 [Cladorrhinum samala]|uniref:F-box domain-containing protein n=1 Tax=Cladorrhinum samala TaxID=585594 RepID=A0AAV9HCM2_9PEZI|nr:hypothetical protein QBC42DRAFT_349531 [Cladorrhinum samala]